MNFRYAFVKIVYDLLVKMSCYLIIVVMWRFDHTTFVSIHLAEGKKSVFFASVQSVDEKRKESH